MASAKAKAADETDLHRITLRSKVGDFRRKLTALTAQFSKDPLQLLQLRPILFGNHIRQLGHQSSEHFLFLCRPSGLWVGLGSRPRSPQWK